MNMTADTRSSAFVRKLRIGDIFIDNDGKWIVTRKPIVLADNTVQVYLKPYPIPHSWTRSKGYVYERDSRVTIIH